MRQRRGGGAPPAMREEYAHEAEDESEDESDGEEEEYMQVGPLSLYFPDALVRALMAREPQLEISFIEAEQALLHGDGDLGLAAQHVRKQRASRARRQAEGGPRGGFEQDVFEEAAAIGGPGGGGPGGGGGGGVGFTHQTAMRWMTSIASSAVLILVFVSLLVVAIVDGVIEVPQSIKDVARDIADSRRP